MKQHNCSVSPTAIKGHLFTLYRFYFNAHSQAFFQLAKLTVIVVMFADDEVLVALEIFFLHGPFKETFATFTTDSHIVMARGFVTTDCTVLHHLELL